MEFWGVEVKSGESFVVEQDDEMILHLSQACLGEVKKDKGSEPVYLFAKVDDKKFVIGILSSEKFPQISLDLVFEKDFELSHNWKNGSVHFTGYKSLVPHGDGEYDDLSDSEDEMVPVPFEHGGSSVQGKPEEKSEDVKQDVKSDQKAKVKDEEESDDDDDDDDFETDEDESEDDKSEEAEEENKVDVGKKRPAEAAKKTSGGDKKAKFQTPEKAVAKPGGNKVGGHTATPHPAKQAGKTAAKNDQPKQQTPKSGGAFPCKSCNRSFGSENALQSHTKAKHATAK